MCCHPDFCHEQRFHRAPHHSWHHNWGCCYSPWYAPPRFSTKEEIIKDLESCLKHLREEAKVVEERIAELKKKG